MNWEILGSTGEWAGAAAVVITLFYLARQVKQQNNFARYNALKDILDGSNQPNELLALHPELRDTYFEGLSNPDSFSRKEFADFAMVFRIYYNQMIKLQRAYDAGLIHEKDWQGFARDYSRFLFSPGGLRWLDEQGKGFQDVTEAFRKTYAAGEISDGIGRRKPTS